MPWGPTVSYSFWNGFVAQNSCQLRSFGVRGAVGGVAGLLVAVVDGGWSLAGSEPRVVSLFLKRNEGEATRKGEGKERKTP